MIPRPDISARNVERGRSNREAVRRLLVAYPGIRTREIGEATGLHPVVVSRHIQRIRREWQDGKPR